jgi:hypothetical protein
MLNGRSQFSIFFLNPEISVNGNDWYSRVRINSY